MSDQPDDRGGTEFAGEHPDSEEVPEEVPPDEDVDIEEDS